MSSILYHENLNFRDLLDAIDKSADGGVALLDENGKLVGLVTDGDIRRAILRGESISSAATTAINFNPKTCNVKEGLESRLDMLTRLGVRHLPIVDDDNNFKSLLRKDALHNSDIPVLIMAGGRGTRLAPLTNDCPKPMLRMGGKPLLENMINHLRLEGFRRIYISVNYLRDVITDYFKDGADFGVRIEYIEENAPLGTGGALGLLDDRNFEAIMVVNGDVVTDINFNSIVDFHREQNSSATSVVTEFETKIKFGVVETRGLHLVNIVEKPTYTHFVNVGCYVFSSNALKYFAKGKKCDIPDALNKMAKSGERTFIFQSSHEWRDLGTPDDYNSLANRFEH